jgi:magnesium transporter
MITHYCKITENETLQEVQTPRTGVWTHVVSPDTEELATLVDMFGLDDVIVEDCSDVFEVPRFEKEGTISYFFVRYPYDVQDVDIDTAPLLIVLGETFLITIAAQEVPFLNPFFDDRRSFSTAHGTTLFLEFMSELVVTYEHKLTHTRKLVYKDMGRVRSIRGRDIQRFVFIEQELNETISALIPTRVWLQQLAKGNHIVISDDDEEMLGDLLITSTQLIDSAQSILKTIQNIRNASEAILTQNLNSTIRMLTAFTIILTIPTLIASLFGMNVPVPLHDNPYGFWFVMALIVAVVLLTIHFFTKNRWI